MAILSRIQKTAHKWANKVAPIDVDVPQEGHRDPYTNAWIPGGVDQAQIRAVAFSAQSTDSDMGVQFRDQGPQEAHEMELIVPTTDGQIHDTDGNAISVHVQGDNKDGTRTFPFGRDVDAYEVVQEIANFTELGGYRWFLMQRDPNYVTP